MAMMPITTRISIKVKPRGIFLMRKYLRIIIKDLAPEYLIHLHEGNWILCIRSKMRNLGIGDKRKSPHINTHRYIGICMSEHHFDMEYTRLAHGTR